jgi:hypothetical protein
VTITSISNATLQALEILIERLENTAPLSDVQRDALASQQIEDAVDGRISTLDTGFPPELHADSEAKFREKIQTTDSDLAAQVRFTAYGVGTYFRVGLAPPPYYPWRVAVLCRKANLKDLERRFLAAWCKHFSTGNGRRYDELVERAQKLGVSV